MIQKNWHALIKPNKLNVEPGDDAGRTVDITDDVLGDCRRGPQEFARFSVERVDAPSLSRDTRYH